MHTPSTLSDLRTTRTLDAFQRWLDHHGWRVSAVRGSSLGEDPLGRWLAESFSDARWINPGDDVPCWLLEARVEPTTDLARRVATTVAAAGNHRGALVVLFGPREGQVCFAVTRVDLREVACWSGSFSALSASDEAMWRLWLSCRSADELWMPLLRHLSRRDVGLKFFRVVRRRFHEIETSWTGVDATDTTARRRLSLRFLCRALFCAFLQDRGGPGVVSLVARLLLLPTGADYRGHTLAAFRTLATPHTRRHPMDPWRGLPWLGNSLFLESPVESLHPHATLSSAVLRRFHEEVIAPWQFGTSGGQGSTTVDTEVLGSVFESLMATAERAESGAFYTPATLVDEVVEQALAHALSASIGRARALDVLAGRPIPAADTERAIEAISELRILDPACGSGAFLIGALQRLADIRARLIRQSGLDDPRLDASCRRSVLSHCIHGVDLSEMAVELCRLRLWLAVVDGVPTHDLWAFPLPSLHTRIRTGDALLSPTDRLAGMTWERPDPALLRERERVVASLRTATDEEPDCIARLRDAEARIADEVDRLRLDTLERRVRERSARTLELFHADDSRAGGDAAVEDADPPVDELALRRALAEVRAWVQRRRDRGWAPEFDAAVHFPDVLARGGFDIVLGNPPWVRIAEVPAEHRTLLRTRFSWMRGLRTTGDAKRGGFGTQADLSVAFAQRAVELARPGGVIALLLPAKLFRAGYGAAFRAGVSRETTLLHLADLTARGPYFDADVYPGLLITRRGRTGSPTHQTATVGHDGDHPDPSHRTRHREGSPPARPMITIEARGDAFEIAPDDLHPDGRVDAPWSLLDRDGAALLRLLHHRAPRLGQLLRPRLGVKTGANDLFLHADLPSEHLHPLVRGCDIRPFVATPGATILLPHDPVTGAVLDAPGPDIVAWAQRHAERLRRRTDSQPDRPLWEVFRVVPDILGHRVVWRDIARTMNAAWLPPVAEGGPVILNSTYAVPVPDEDAAWCLLLWLHAAPVRFVLAATADPAMGGYLRVNGDTASRLPLPPSVLGRGPVDAARDWRRLADRARSIVDLRERMAIVDRAAANLLRLDPGEQRTLARLAPPIDTSARATRRSTRVGREES